jgi:hypothetical protein
VESHYQRGLARTVPAHHNAANDPENSAELEVRDPANQGSVDSFKPFKFIASTEFYTFSSALFGTLRSSSAGGRVLTAGALRAVPSIAKCEP